MSALKNKIDFVLLVSVSMANCNGDPLNGNRPRTDYNGFGEISDVCIKRKLRNRMQDMGQNIFVQSDDRCDDGFGSLKERANATLKNIKSREESAKLACETWLDVRTFGQVFAFGTGKKGEGVSIPVRGPVSIHMGRSVSPVEIESLQITKSVSGDKAEDEKRGKDTMGMKHFVRFGLYKIKGSINVQLAEKTGFSEEDAEVVKECLRTLFENDASSARPEGSRTAEGSFNGNGRQENRQSSPIPFWAKRHLGDWSHTYRHCFWPGISEMIWMVIRRFFGSEVSLCWLSLPRAY